MIKCLICGYETKMSLQNHLKYSHNMTCKDYENEYKVPSKSQEWSDMMTKRNKSNKMREASRNKSKKAIENISKSATERNKNMWKNPEYRKHMKETLSRTQRNYMNSEEGKKRQREVMLKNWSNPKIAERMLNAPKSNWGCAKRKVYYSEKFNKEFKLKSIGELEFLLTCESIDSITFLDYESVHIKTSDKIYTPDFRVVQDGKVYIIEVKYDNLYQDNMKIVNIALDYCLENNFEFCWMRRFKEIPQLKKNKLLSEFVLCRSKNG